MKLSRVFIFCLMGLSASSPLQSGAQARKLFNTAAQKRSTARAMPNSFCDRGVLIEKSEREHLFQSLRESQIGQQLLKDFEKKYDSLDYLYLQWNTVSYSQLSTDSSPQRIILSDTETTFIPKVCIHLTERLPDIEHIADLAHELVHATRLTPEVLAGEVRTAQEFVSSRIKSKGGEAEAFAVECKVKFEINGEWDQLCEPYVSLIRPDEINVNQIIQDLYNGQLSASLTGEAYPKMLARQFKIMTQQRKSQRQPASAR